MNAVARLGLLAVLAGSLVACGGESSDSVETTTTTRPATSTTTAMSTTSSSPTTTSTTAAPPPTSSSSSTTTTPTTVAPTAGFDPPCTDVEPSRPVPHFDEAAVDMFGPLERTPSIDIRLPAGRSELTGELFSAVGSAERIPGGVLLSVVSSSSGYFPGAMLAAIDHDGALRWRRCLPTNVLGGGLVAADPSSNPSVVLVGSYALAPGTFDIGWSVVSLADGSFEGSLDDVVATSPPPGGWRVLASSRNTALLGLDPLQVVDTSVDQLVVLDLVTLETRSTSYPPELEGRSADTDLAFGDDGRIVLFGTGVGGIGRMARAVEVDGVWVADPEYLRLAVPITAGFDYAAASAHLRSVDAVGEVLWRREDVAVIPVEGFQSAVDEGVVVAASCTGLTTFGCEEFELGGYSMATGETVWLLPGQRQVTAIGDGSAMISVPAADGRPAGWMLIDTRFGTIAAPDQRWDDSSLFVTECCGGTEAYRVDRFGGMLVVFSGENMYVWHPVGQGTPTTSLDLG